MIYSCSSICHLCFCLQIVLTSVLSFFFFFNATATTEIYTLSLHDALPIWRRCGRLRVRPAARRATPGRPPSGAPSPPDRKSTRLNSSHTVISYAVFCLKKKNISPASTPSLTHLPSPIAAPCQPARLLVHAT